MNTFFNPFTIVWCTISYITSVTSVLGRVHATDYSNASATGIFDSYQVWHLLLLFTLYSVFVRLAL